MVSSPETANHAFRSCHRAQCPPSLTPDSNNLLAWLRDNFSSKFVHPSGVEWNIIFPIACRHIWTSHNKTLFKPNSILHSDSSALTLRNIVAKSVEWAFIISRNREKIIRQVLVGWEPPCAGYFKHNIDGAFKMETGQSFIGGLLRNHEG